MTFQQKQMILKWKDNQDTTIKSSFHDGALQDVTTNKNVVQMPIAVLDYNKNRGELMVHVNKIKYPTVFSVKLF
jgi:hypothetical protein